MPTAGRPVQSYRIARQLYSAERGVRLGLNRPMFCLQFSMYWCWEDRAAHVEAGAYGSRSVVSRYPLCHHWGAPLRLPDEWGRMRQAD